MDNLDIGMLIERFKEEDSPRDKLFLEILENKFKNSQKGKEMGLSASNEVELPETPIKTSMGGLTI